MKKRHIPRFAKSYFQGSNAKGVSWFDNGGVNQLEGKNIKRNSNKTRAKGKRK